MKIKTSHGNFYLEATERGLYRLEFPGRPLTLPSPQRGEGNPTTLRWWDKGEGAVLRQAEKLLREYFLNRSVSFRSLKLDLSGYTSFERSVLKTLSRIPSGRTISYAGLARKSGFPRAARAVGSVMQKNRLPIILPCHRVVRSGGGLGGYSKGLAWKKRLLTVEKINREKQTLAAGKSMI